MTRLPRYGRSASTVALLCSIVAFAAAPVLADPIVLTVRGSSSIEHAPDVPASHVSLTAPEGFVLRGGGAGTTPGNCDPCLGGDAVSLSNTIFIHDGELTFGGVSQEFDSRRDAAGGELSFSSAAFTLPLTASDPVVFSAPFTMTGTFFFRGFDSGLSDLDFALSGSGRATGTFLPGGRSTLGQDFAFGSVAFEFAEPASTTPEPGTLLLVATAAAAAISDVDAESGRAAAQRDAIDRRANAPRVPAILESAPAARFGVASRSHGRA